MTMTTWYLPDLECYTSIPQQSTEHNVAVSTLIDGSFRIQRSVSHQLSIHWTGRNEAD